MEQFRKKTAHFASSDEGVKVAELITLVDNNPLAKEILKLLDVKSILGEIIQIPGSRDLVKIQNAMKKASEFAARCAQKKVHLDMEYQLQEEQKFREV